jgi:hypothetical protein
LCPAEKEVIGLPPVAYTTFLSYHSRGGTEEPMTRNDDIRKQLDTLRRHWRGLRSLIEMMEKGTPRDELQKIRAAKLKPLEEDIRKLEEELSKV